MSEFRLPLGINYMTNLVSSLQAFLDTNVVTPYNAAVLNTTYADPIQIIMHHPDDAFMASKVPAIVLLDPIKTKSVESTGNGDGLVWNYYALNMDVYPAVNTDTNGVQTPVLIPGYMLRGLFDSLLTSLTMPLYDFTTTPTKTLVDYAYITGGSLTTPRGTPALLGLFKHRFSFRLDVKFATATLGGA